MVVNKKRLDALLVSWLVHNRKGWMRMDAEGEKVMSEECIVGRRSQGSKQAECLNESLLDESIKKSMFIDLQIG